MLLRTLLDWLFCFGTRALRALVLSHRGEHGVATTAIALVSLAGGATLLISTTIDSADVSFEALASTVRSSVNRVSANLEVRGSTIAHSKDSRTVDRIALTVGLFGQGAVPLDGGDDRLTISYRDETTYLPSVPFIATFLDGDGDELLDPGELSALTVDLAGAGIDLRANERFTLELNAPVGGTVEISRTMPFVLQPVMSLH